MVKVILNFAEDARSAMLRGGRFSEHSKSNIRPQKDVMLVLEKAFH